MEVTTKTTAPFAWNSFDRLFDEVFSSSPTHSPPPKSFPPHLTPEYLFPNHAKSDGYMTTSARRRIIQGPIEKLQTPQSRFTMHQLADANSNIYLFDLPGITKQDVHISYQGCQVVVSWTTYSITERNDGNQRITERKQTKYSRTVPLPPGVSIRDVKASFKSDALVVSYPLTSEGSIEFADY